MWINPKTKQVFKLHSAIRAACPNPTLPVIITDEVLVEAGFHPVLQADPHFNPITQEATELTPELVDGVWCQKWVVTDLPAEAVEANKKAVLDTARSTLRDFVQSVMDQTAATRGYDNILSACTYATSTVEKFRSEGQACVDWRDKMWSECYRLLDEVLAGTRPVPTTGELLKLLPEIEWPAAS